jgi:hypothetical protein
LVIESGGNPSAPNFIGPFINIETRYWLAAAKSFKIYNNVVANCSCAINVDKRSETTKRRTDLRRYGALLGEPAQLSAC